MCNPLLAAILSAIYLLAATPAALAAAAVSEKPAAATSAATPQEPSAKAAPAVSDASPTMALPANSSGGAETNDEVTPLVDPLAGPSEAVKADLEARLKSLDESPLTDDAKKSIREQLQQALVSYAAAVEQAKSARDLRKRLDVLPAEQQNAAQRLAKTLLPSEDVSQETIAQIEGHLSRADQWLAQYRESLKDAQSWLDGRTRRVAELPAQIAALRQQLVEMDKPASIETAADAADLAAFAKRTSAELRRQAAEATIRTLELEQRYNQEAVQLYQLGRDHWIRKISQREKRVAELRDILNRRREAAAQVAQAEARQTAAAAAQRPALIADLAQANAQLAERRTQIVARHKDATQLEAVANEQRDALKTEFDRAQQQDQLKELSDATGQLLRQQQAKLPNLRELKRRRIRRDSERSAIQLQQYDLQYQRSELADVEEVADHFGAATLNDAERAEVIELLQAKVGYLDDLKKEYDDYWATLNKLGGAEGELASTTELYANFIAERVLWIRSCAAPRAADLRPAGDALAWSLNPANWRDSANALLRSIVRRPLVAALLLAAWALSVVVQRSVRARLALRGEDAVKRGCTRLQPTREALWLTALMALPWPAAAALIGWALDNPLGESEFVRALSIAVRFAAVILLIFELTRHVCREGGLADAHFGWPTARLSAVRRALRMLTMFVLPLVLWTAGLETQTEQPLASSTLGRACFVAAMGILATVLYRLLLAQASPFREGAPDDEASPWLAPVRAVWRHATAASPIALGALAIAGYYYTAQQAALGLLQTGPLMLAVMTLGGVMRRWLLVNRRRLAREQARQRRAQLTALAAEGDGTALAAIELVDETVDLAALGEQTRKLIRTVLAVVAAGGLWFIWSDLLPAMQYLGNHPLLPWAAVAAGEAPLTWGRLLEFLAVAAMTYAAVRDIPALLELVVLQYLPLDGGVRYALATLCRYTLGAFGAVIAFQTIGVQWASIQWLVAAMSVGLGFGLQEIFGNFVSGVILLFERPIRVGDVVTLGETTGVVSRIRMRATTIVDWDRKEYIVPNKDLVMQRLLNWTLSDQINRIVVKVGVAYGSDTDAACRLLVESAQEQPHVLREPAPVAQFEGFGDSCLKLSLQCFLPSLEFRTITTHQLNTTIDRKFREAGLEIPYPSREMRVRLVGEIPQGMTGPQLAPQAHHPRRPRGKAG